MLIESERERERTQIVLKNAKPGNILLGVHNSQGRQLILFSILITSGKGQSASGLQLLPFGRCSRGIPIMTFDISRIPVNS